MANSIMILHPYMHGNNWVFDDKATGLYREAFVGGTTEIISHFTKDIPDAKNGFSLIFGGTPFPGYDTRLELIGPDDKFGGNWYFCPETGTNGWLCPSLFKYFPEAPKYIYAKCEPLHR